MKTFRKNISCFSAFKGLCLLASIAMFASTVFFTSCKKREILPEQKASATNQRPLKINPYSVANISKAIVEVNRKADVNMRISEELNEDRIYAYVKFSPEKVSPEMLELFEADTIIRIMKFPFANPELYGKQVVIDEKTAEQLEDGMLYAVLKSSSPLFEKMMASNELDVTLLDRLYLPEENDTTLQMEALRQAGYDDAELTNMRVCLLKRPRGFVRYADQALGNALQPVHGMEVFALVFGIPKKAYTNQDGFYQIPWRFSIGTIMGTHAKNNRVNVKPFNTVGGFFSVVPQLITNFIAGSVWIRGTVPSCDMRGNVDFNFVAHQQNRYWAQVLNSVSLHDRYASAEGIRTAPFNDLVVYAHWADRDGAASAPMLRRIGANRALIEGLINWIFNSNVVNTAPSLFNLLNGLLPDVTIKVSRTQSVDYSADLMQTMFHELGHGSHFSAVGSVYWIPVITNTLVAATSPCGGYGCGNEAWAGHTQLSEAWAEFQGKRHAERYFRERGRTDITTFYGAVRDATGVIIEPQMRRTFIIALEEKRFHFNWWIPTGIFNDFMDARNLTLEPFDLVEGLTVAQMYNALHQSTTNICSYRARLLAMNPVLNAANVDAILLSHGIRNCR